MTDSPTTFTLTQDDSSRRSEIRHSFLLLTGAVLAALATGLAYAWTYPLNIGMSDCPNYLRMIASGSSNLINASGYPALIHALLAPLGAMPKADPLIDTAWLRNLQWFQVAVHSVLFLACIAIICRLYGRLAAAACAVLWGCNLLFLANLNSASPEWLQGDLLLLCVLVCFCARRSTRNLRKAVLYVVGATLLACAYLVKFNSLLLALPVSALVVVDRQKTWQKLATLAAGALVFVASTSLYANTYHFRSTGTKKLSYDHAWVLILALPDDYFQTTPQMLGTDSLRWAYLATHVPAEYGRSHAYQHISYGSANWGAFRPIWNAAMAMRRGELEAHAQANPRPPRGRNIDLTAPFYYYYGAELTDPFGIRVYLEAWRTHFGYFIFRIAHTIGKIAIAPPSEQVAPTLTSPLGLQWGGVQKGWIQISPPSAASPYGVGYFNPSERAWLNGVKAFAWLQQAGSWRAPYYVMLLAALGTIWFGRSRPDWRETAVITSSLALMACASAVLLGFRVKEIATVTPLFFALAGVGLYNLLQLLRSLGARFQSVASPR